MKVQLLILSLCLTISSIICLSSSNLKQVNSNLTLQQGNSVIPVINQSTGISIKNSAVSVVPNPPVQIQQVRTVITEEEKYHFNDLNTFRKAALDEHNRLRQIHNAPKLKISKSLNTSAQSWANYLANANMYANLTQNKDFTKSNKENSEIYQNVLEKSQFPFSGNEMTDYWYKQGESYNFATNTPLNESENTEAFVQIIWKGTTEVGFGRAYGKNGYYGVAYYRSSAKESSQYPINISPPIQTQLNIIVSKFTGRLFNNQVTRSVQVSSSSISTPNIGDENVVSSSDQIIQDPSQQNKNFKKTAIIIKKKGPKRGLNKIANLLGSNTQVNFQANQNSQPDYNNQVSQINPLNQNNQVNQSNLNNQVNVQANQGNQLTQNNQANSSGNSTTSILTPNNQQQYYQENILNNNQLYPQQSAVAKKLRKKSK